jgi:hypothetical protein
VWDVGSYVSIGTTESYSNPFEIVFYYKSGKSYYIKKVDNLGFSLAKKFIPDSLISFLDANISIMQNEELTSRKDTINKTTIRSEDGQIIAESYTVTSSTIDHQQVDRVWVNYKGQAVSYHFPAEFADNKWNLRKKRFLFLSLLQRTSEHVRSKLYQRPAH